VTTPMMAPVRVESGHTARQDWWVCCAGSVTQTRTEHIAPDDEPAEMFAHDATQDLHDTVLALAAVSNDAATVEQTSRSVRTLLTV